MTTSHLQGGTHPGGTHLAQTPADHTPQAGADTSAAQHGAGTPDGGGAPDGTPDLPTGKLDQAPADSSGNGGSGFKDTLVNGLQTGADLGAATAAGASSGMETEAFLTGMRGLAYETNHVQYVMGQLNLGKTLAEGFAKFIKEMGKGFVQQ
jgi:hypothetical protein